MRISDCSSDVCSSDLVRVFQIPGLIVMPVVFAICATSNLEWLNVGIFFAGLLTVGQFSFWGNYLPRAYPLHLRGTGESFAARSEERRVGKECVRKCKSRWSRYH